ncbi:MAG: hypothetical protein MUF37_04255 [Methanoregulaceae archaeon]|nr:hypothetical protein [Methanoregulaceae archaeon]
MRSCNRLLFIAGLVVIIALCTLFAGCTSMQEIVQPPATTPLPAPVETTGPVGTNVVPTTAVVQTLPAEPIRKPLSDTEFLLAYNTSQAKILDLVITINTELIKDSVQGNISPDYTALGSYARRLGSSADEEIAGMLKFREISDQANESRKEYYINYLMRLKPFAANLETGSSLAQKRDFNLASRFFSNAKNDLTLVRAQEMPEHLKVISQVRENLGPFMDRIEQQGTYPVPA